MTYHNPNITYLKGFAILGVILTHLISPTSFLLRFVWAYAIRLAVPLFLIITGYLLTMSWEKHQETFRSYYAKTLPKKILMLGSPFLVVAVIELCLILSTTSQRLSFWRLIKFLMLGGAGPGNYFFPLIIQIYLLYPLLRYHNRSNIILWMGVSCFSDMLVHWGYLNLFLSHFICLRYLFFVAAGIFCHQKSELFFQSGKWIFPWILSICIGISVIFCFNFTPFSPSIYIPQASWSVTFFLVPIFIWIIHLPPLPLGKSGRLILGWMGENTWYIYLCQMFLFYAVWLLFPRTKDLILPSVFGKLAFFLFIFLFSYVFIFSIESLRNCIFKLAEQYVKKRKRK